MVSCERLVIVGGGMAAMRLLEELEARGSFSPALLPAKDLGDRRSGASGETGDQRQARFEVTVIGAETRPAYNRILLSPLLSGEMAWEDVCLKPAEWYAERGIRLVLGDAAIALDPATKTITLAS